MKEIKRNILLNPGPATTTDTVKYAQVMPDICPREKEFGELMHYICDELTGFVADKKDYATVLFGGSGTAVVEAIISSVIGDGEVLIINNGAYGKRMCQIADAYDINYSEFISSGTEPIDIDEVIEIIKTNPNITHISVVHHETTTGLLNDIESIGALCKKHSLDLIVDTVSSYAAIPIDMKKMNISFMASTSNKNIQGMAGVGFVIANKEALEKTKTIKPKNYYLNLYAQYEYFIKTDQTRFTPPVQTLYALKQAIKETKEEGVEQRYQRYSAAWNVLIDGLENLGLKILLKREHQSKLITTIIDPENPNYDFEKMHDYLYDESFTIYPGKVQDTNTFRLANIGAIDSTDINNFLLVLEKYLLSIK
jgi:2-aminoethylphosphonate-pyruvate transaminase